MVAVTGHACKEAAGGGAGAGEAAKIPWRTGAMLWSISRLQTLTGLRCGYGRPAMAWRRSRRRRKRVGRSSRKGAATLEWRGVQRELKAVVPGPLLEARSEAVTV